MNKKILFGIIFISLIVGTFVIAQVLNATDSTISVDKKYADIVKGTYTAGERLCDGNICKERISGKYLNTMFITKEKKCLEYDEKEKCINEQKKTEQEITTERNAFIKNQLEKIAKIIIDKRAETTPTPTTAGGTITIQ